MFLITQRCQRSLRLVALLGLAIAALQLVDPDVAEASPTPEVTVVRDVPYAQEENTERVLDVYPSDAAEAAPVVMVIHGGGWTGGDKKDFAVESRALATAGFVVFSINYTLDASAGPAYPRQVQDVRAALSWVQAHAAEYGGDRDRIGILGGSAGAYLAAMLGTQVNTADAQPVRAVVSLSGPMDISALVADLRAGPTIRPTACATNATCAAIPNGPNSLAVLLGCEPLTCPPDLLAQASPVTYVTEYSPPFFLAHSAEEPVADTQAMRMAAQLRERGVPVEVRIAPGNGHSSAYLPAIAEPLLDFLAASLAKVTPTPTPTTTAPVATPEPMPGRSSPLWWLLGVVVAALLAAAIFVRRLRDADG